MGIGPVANLLPGMSAGAVGVLIGYPLETLKTQMQMNTSCGNWTLLRQLRTTCQTRRCWSLYSGIAPSLVSQMLRRSYQFWAYESMKRWTNPYVAGGISGLLGCPISAPFHLVRTKLQLGQYSTVRDCVKTIVRTDGWGGIYRGVQVHTFREMMFSCIYLGNYDRLRHWYQYFLSKPYVPSITNTGPTINFLAGATSSFITWGICFPLNTLETAIQSGSGYQVIKTKINRYGYFNLWKGFTPVAIRIVPVSGSSMIVYEWVRQAVAT